MQPRNQIRPRVEELGARIVPAHVLHRAQGNARLPGQRVARRGDQHQLIPVEDLRFKVLLPDAALGQPDVQLVPGEAAVDLLGVLDLDQ